MSGLADTAAQLLRGPLRAFLDGAAATLLLGLVFSGAQWLLAWIYGENLG